MEKLRQKKLNEFFVMSSDKRIGERKINIQNKRKKEDVKEDKTKKLKNNCDDIYDGSDVEFVCSFIIDENVKTSGRNQKARRKIFNVTDESIAIEDSSLAKTKTTPLRENREIVVSTEKNESIETLNLSIDVENEVQTSCNFTSFSSSDKRTILSLNRPTTQSRTPEKLKPRILQLKGKTGQETTKSFLEEFTSTDFLTENGKELSSAKSNIEEENSCKEKCKIEGLKTDYSKNKNVLDVISIKENLTLILNSCFVPDFNRCRSRSPRKSPKASRRLSYNSPKKNSSVKSPKSSPRKSSTTSPVYSQMSPVKISTQQNFQNSSNRQELHIKTPTGILILRKIMKYILSKINLYNLLCNEEEEMLLNFFKMPVNYQFFCFKLYTRQPKWYNIYKLTNDIKLNLSKEEIQEMYNVLSSYNFVFTDYSNETTVSLLNHLILPEIKCLSDSFRLKLKSTSKQIMIDSLLEHCNKQTTLTFLKSSDQILRGRIQEKMGYCVKLSQKLYNTFYKIHLLYSFPDSSFLNVSNLHLFMGKVIYNDITLPSYKIDDLFIFESIEEFNSFSQATEYYNELIKAFDDKKIENMLEIARKVFKEFQEIIQAGKLNKPKHLVCFTAGHKYASTLSTACKHLTVHCPAEVRNWLKTLLKQDYYCQRKRGFWSEQLAMVSMKYFKDLEEASEVIIKALMDDSISVINQHNLSNRAMILIKSKKVSHCQKETLRKLTLKPPDENPFPVFVLDANAIQGNQTGVKRMYVEKKENGESQYYTVEEIAKKHYLKNGYKHGIHCEGSLIQNLFILLFWDVIYDIEVPGAFIGELQQLPLDFYNQDFYFNRREQIDLKLKEIESGWSMENLKEVLTDNWISHRNLCPLYNDNMLEIDDFCDVVECIGRKIFSQILERFVKNIRLFHSGMPDLFLWNPETKKSKFVEVKGEKDKLSIKQKLWLDYLRNIGSDIEVCHVHTVGSKAFEKFKYNQVNQTIVIIEDSEDEFNV